ncbi:hypothetical protein FIBSPDRAFT_862065 [Athelia psychrophila]|uniref:Uncharacterized protein n=1 Tax=Athelia psychrophila TaxID=1759441 RepID=A0A166IP70_9AGAM|nr:hypothetical protein FIBSPDRAFT_862065 [Fibularhizoctonia sp. CBS 109695]
MHLPNLPACPPLVPTHTHTQATTHTPSQHVCPTRSQTHVPARSPAVTCACTIPSSHAHTLPARVCA